MREHAARRVPEPTLAAPSVPGGRRGIRQNERVGMITGANIARGVGVRAKALVNDCIGVQGMAIPATPYYANKGKPVALVPADIASAKLAAIRAHPRGNATATTDEVGGTSRGGVIMQTALGGRGADLQAEQLPRIC